MFCGTDNISWNILDVFHIQSLVLVVTRMSFHGITIFVLLVI